MARNNWKMPKWMEPYRSLLSDPDRAEEAENCDGVNCNLVINGPKALIHCSISGQIAMLERLHIARLLVKKEQP